MSKIYILAVDDESSVIDIVAGDLAPLEDFFPVETASDAGTARMRIEEIEQRGDRVGLILCDHVMPGENGVDLLIWMHGREPTHATRKVLLTGQAGLDSTIKAVNRADLCQYIAKPWKREDLVQVAREQLSHYVLERGVEVKGLLPALDPIIMGDAIRKGLMGDA